jgi:hypothetical protein
MKIAASRNKLLYPRKYAKLHIDKDYFYFTGHHENLDGTKPVEFQSLNFDVRFIDTIQNQFIKHQESMVN